MSQTNPLNLAMEILNSLAARQSDLVGEKAGLNHSNSNTNNNVLDKGSLINDPHQADCTSALISNLTSPMAIHNTTDVHSECNNAGSVSTTQVPTNLRNLSLQLLDLVQSSSSPSSSSSSTTTSANDLINSHKWTNNCYNSSLPVSMTNLLPNVLENHSVGLTKPDWSTGVSPSPVAVFQHAVAQLALLGLSSPTRTENGEPGFGRPSGQLLNLSVKKAEPTTINTTNISTSSSGSTTTTNPQTTMVKETVKLKDARHRVTSPSGQITGQTISYTKSEEGSKVIIRQTADADEHFFKALRRLKVGASSVPNYNNDLHKVTQVVSQLDLMSNQSTSTSSSFSDMHKTRGEKDVQKLSAAELAVDEHFKKSLAAFHASTNKQTDSLEDQVKNNNSVSPSHFFHDNTSSFTDTQQQSSLQFPFTNDHVHKVQSHLNEARWLGNPDSVHRAIDENPSSLDSCKSPTGNARFQAKFTSAGLPPLLPLNSFKPKKNWLAQYDWRHQQSDSNGSPITPNAHQMTFDSSNASSPASVSIQIDDTTMTNATSNVLPRFQTTLKMNDYEDESSNNNTDKRRTISQVSIKPINLTSGNILEDHLSDQEKDYPQVEYNDEEDELGNSLSEAHKTDYQETSIQGLVNLERRYTSTHARKPYSPDIILVDASDDTSESDRRDSISNIPINASSVTSVRSSGPTFYSVSPSPTFREGQASTVSDVAMHTSVTFNGSTCSLDSAMSFMNRRSSDEKVNNINCNQTEESNSTTNHDDVVEKGEGDELQHFTWSLRKRVSSEVSCWSTLKRSRSVLTSPIAYGDSCSSYNPSSREMGSDDVEDTSMININRASQNERSFVHSRSMDEHFSPTPPPQSASRRLNALSKITDTKGRSDNSAQPLSASFRSSASNQESSCELRLGKSDTINQTNQSSMGNMGRSLSENTAFPSFHHNHESEVFMSQ